MNLKHQFKSTIIFFIFGVSIVSPIVSSDEITLKDRTLKGTVIKISDNELEVQVGCKANDTRTYAWDKIYKVDIDESDACTFHGTSLFGRIFGSGLDQNICSSEVKHYYSVIFRSKGGNLNLVTKKINLSGQQVRIKLLVEEKNILGPINKIKSIERVFYCPGDNIPKKERWPPSYNYAG